MNKLKIILFSITFLCLNACSMDLSRGNNRLFHTMFSSNEWQAKGYPFNDNDFAHCVIDGGKNSIRVILEITREKSGMNSFIRSTRPMPPGTIFIITSWDSSFRTRSKELSARQSKSIVDDLKNQKTVYLRWSESDGRGRQNFTSQVAPKYFISPYQKCITFIEKQKNITDFVEVG